MALAIVTSQYGVLLVRRRDDSPPWAFPGEEIETGETSEQAAARETLEETGLVVIARNQLSERAHPSTGRRIVDVAAVPATDRTDIHVADSAAIDEVRWVPFGNVRELLVDLHKPVADYFSKYATTSGLSHSSEVVSLENARQVVCEAHNDNYGLTSNVLSGVTRGGGAMPLSLS